MLNLKYHKEVTFALRFREVSPTMGSLWGMGRPIDCM
jgi:hypothetical protein